MMNLNRMAALIIRLFGVSFLINYALECTLLPHYLMQSRYAHERNLALAADYDFQTLMYFCRGLIYLGAGVGFLLGWKRILHLLSKVDRVERE